MRPTPALLTPALVAGCLSSARPPAAAERAAAAAGFVRVAQRDLDADRFADEVRLDGAPRVRALRVVIERGAVRLRELIVRFDDGLVFEPRLRGTFEADSASRVIDLPDGPRAIHDVALDYGGHSPGARVELWAR